MKIGILRLGAFVVLGLILAASVSGLFFATVSYNTGWEIGSQFSSASINTVSASPESVGSDFINGSYLNNVGGYLKLDDPNIDPNSPLYVNNEEFFGSTAVYIDVDPPYPVTKDAYGSEWYKTTDGDPYRTYSKQDALDSETWHFFDHYVYYYTVDVKTNAVTKAIPYGLTNYVYGTCEGLPTFLPQEHEAHVRVFSEFGLSPWRVQDGQIYTLEDDDEFEVSDVFYGIMSATVGGLSSGSVLPLPTSYDGRLLGYATHDKDHVGAGLAMWRTDGVTSVDGGYTDPTGDIAEGIVYSVPNTIPKSVIIETSFRMLPGFSYNGGTFPGTWSDWTVINNFARYLVCVQAVYTAGLTLIAGEVEPAGNKTDYHPPDDVLNAWEIMEREIDDVFLKIGSGMKDMQNAMMFSMIVIVVVVVAIALIFLFGGRL